MKRLFVIFTVVVSMLVACMPTAPAETEAPVPASPTLEVSLEPQGKMAAPSFESQPYVDEANGFMLDYPVGWTVKQTMSGERGSQSVLLSAPEVADLEALPPGATRIGVTLNQWDPKNDLAAFVESRKTAWSASGFTILSEEHLTLDLGLDAVRFTVQTTDSLTAIFQFSVVDDQYLTLSGEGDLTLAAEIMNYLRPLN